MGDEKEVKVTRVDQFEQLGAVHPATRSPALWRRPGGQLLRAILPAWREAVPGDAVDGFVARKLHELVQAAETWILDDSRRRSQAAIPDDVLDAALEAAAEGEEDAIRAIAEGVVGDYWAMKALHRRGEDLHRMGGRLLSDALGHVGGEHGALVAAVLGERPSGFRPPIYRASPTTQEDKEAEEELRELLDESVLSLLRVQPHTLDSLQHEAKVARGQVVATLNRLVNKGRIWRHAPEGKVPQYAPITSSIGLRPAPKGRMGRGGHPSADEVHGGPAREAGQRALAKAKALGGSATRATDLLRPDADGRTLARALMDLTEPRLPWGEVHGFLRDRKLHGAAEEIWKTPNAVPEFLQRRVWEKVLLEEPVIRVKGTSAGPRVLPAAIREDADTTWVAARRVEAGRASLTRVEVEVVSSNANGSVTVRPLGRDVLRPEDEVHLWVRSSPDRLFELYNVLGRFFDDLKDKPDDLASVRPLLFWTGVMLDTPQCTGEARQAATRAFKQAKLYYDVARESRSSRGSVWTMGVLHRVAAAASAVASACAEGKRPLPGLVFFEPSWEPRFPDSMSTPRLRALYEVLGQNPGLALRVDAAAAGVDEEQLAAAISPLLPGEQAVERIVEVLKSVETMSADRPGASSATRGSSSGSSSSVAEAAPPGLNTKTRPPVSHGRGQHHGTGLSPRLACSSTTRSTSGSTATSLTPGQPCMRVGQPGEFGQRPAALQKSRP